jgi:hypothetical protein
MQSTIKSPFVAPSSRQEPVPVQKGENFFVDRYALGFRGLSDFESQLSHLVSEGFRPCDFLDFFGEQHRGSPFIEAAERLFDLGTGDFSFDSAPLIRASEYGAYVSAWVWVDAGPDSIGCDAELESSPDECGAEFNEQLRVMRDDGLTAQMCIDFFGLRERNLDYVVRARRQYARGRGVIVFDADPMVSESEDGAYVSVWLWVWNREISANEANSLKTTPPDSCCRSATSKEKRCSTRLCSYYK